MLRQPTHRPCLMQKKEHELENALDPINGKRPLKVYLHINKPRYQNSNIIFNFVFEYHNILFKNLRNKKTKNKKKIPTYILANIDSLFVNCRTRSCSSTSRGWAATFSYPSFWALLEWSFLICLTGAPCSDHKENMTCVIVSPSPLTQDSLIAVESRSQPICGADILGFRDNFFSFLGLFFLIFYGEERDVNGKKIIRIRVFN